MEWKSVLFLLLLWATIVDQSEVYSAPRKSSSVLKKWLNNLFSGWIPRSSSFNRKSTPSAPLIESSFTPDKELLLSSRQYSGCTCSSSSCTTTCYSLSSQCFRTCTITTEFYVTYVTNTSPTLTYYTVTFTLSLITYTSIFSYYDTSVSTISYLTTYSTRCNQVTAGCTATAVAVAAGAAAVAIAVGVAVPLGIPPTINPTALPGSFFFNNPMPVNSNPSPGGGGASLPDDGCGTSSGRFDSENSIQQINERKIKREENWTLKDGNCTQQKDENAFKRELEKDQNWIRTHGTWDFSGNRNNCTRLDGKCYRLMSIGPCRNHRFWFTLDPRSLKGRCTPRLCGRERVFVGKTGLCHDSEDPSICSRGRKLYYTSYGDPICDCPVGKYPFPGGQDECITIFTRGPCPIGQVVDFGQTGDNLQCTPSQCPFNRNDEIPLVPYEDGRCYALGSQGPCRQQPFQLLGYDVFERRSVCVNVTAIGSPYFELEEEIDKINTIINHDQLLPKYDDFRVSFFATKPAGKKQGDAHTTGLFQLIPNFPKDPLLNPCRSGARNGNNYKCTNPILLLGKRQRLLQAVRSAFECPDDSVLQATGQCGNDSRSASCGPSYHYVESIGECRAIFRP